MSAREAARHLRAIADALVEGDPTDPAIVRLGDQLAAVAGTLPAAPATSPGGSPRARRWEDTSVFSGALNVVAAPMKVWSPTANSERTNRDPNRNLESEAPALPELWASVTLGPRYEGPASSAHGGIVAGLLDELLGATVSQLGDPVVTGKLTLRYPGRTPLAVPLSLRAWVTETRSRVVLADATLGFEDADGTRTVTAEATAMFVRVPAE